MTIKVIETLNRIKELDIFEKQPLYFIGGTALSYYLNHRISEDIDIVSPNILNYRDIYNIMFSLGAKEEKDENESLLRIAGIYPPEFILKFKLDDIKVEFFRASTPSQLKIIKNAKTSNYLDSKIQILDVKSISKLKIVALLQRDKARDLFDAKEILSKDILTKEELLEISNKTNKNINNLDDLFTFISLKKESKNDEKVYLDEQNPTPISFDKIKNEVLKEITIFKFTDQIKEISPGYKLLTIDEYNSKLFQKLENKEELKDNYIEFLKLELKSISNNSKDLDNDNEPDNSPKI